MTELHQRVIDAGGRLIKTGGERCVCCRRKMEVAITLNSRGFLEWNYTHKCEPREPQEEQEERDLTFDERMQMAERMVKWGQF